MGLEPRAIGSNGVAVAWSLASIAAVSARRPYPPKSETALPREFLPRALREACRFGLGLYAAAMPFWSTRRVLFLVLILFLAAAGVIAASNPHWIKIWVANRYAARAEALAKAGGMEASRMAALRALNYNPDCVRALKAMLSTASDPKSVVFLRSRLADLQPGDQENLAALALLGSVTGHFQLAGKALVELEQGKFSPAKINELRSRLAAAEGNFSEAGEYAARLLEAEPSNQVGRLIRALSQVHLGDESQRNQTTGELRELARDSALGLEARRGLRHVALLNKDWAGAQAVSSSIVANPSARFDDWMAHADVVFRLEPGRLAAILPDLTRSAGDSAEALALIGQWLRKIGKAGEVVAWIKQSQALQANPVLAQMIEAETLMAQGQWAALGSFLQPLKWERKEFYRMALIARCQQKQGEPFLERWNAAVASAMKSSDLARQLGELVLNWPGWESQAEEFLWLAQKKNPANLRWALEGLSRYYQAGKNTLGLLRVTEELNRSFPASEPIQNNLAFYSLLLNTHLERSWRSCQDLYQAHPNAPEIASTYSLALIRKQNFDQALEVFRKLPPALLSRNDIAPYYAAALFGAGLKEEALAVRQRINQADLLPEERVLLEFQ